MRTRDIAWCTNRKSPPPTAVSRYPYENDNDAAYGDEPYEAEPAYDAPPVQQPMPVYRGHHMPLQNNRPMPDRAPAADQRSGIREWEAGDFVLPPLKLLTSPPPHQKDPELSDAALGRRAEMLQSVLEDFRIKGQITGVHPGPVITLYEFEPARGTKSSRVISLADDIARSMSAVSARVAVIPGRDAIGIELPNQNREVVYLRELLEAKDFGDAKGRLQLALGKTIGGDPVIVDLAQDAASAHRGHHRLRQVGRDQHHDRLSALPDDAGGMPLHHDRSEDAGAVRL